MTYYLINNCGSSSQKFELLEEVGDVTRDGPSALKSIARGNAQKVNVAGDSPVTLDYRGEKSETVVHLNSHTEAIQFFSQWLDSKISGFEPAAIGHKWVYAGEEYNGTHILYKASTGETKTVEMTRKFNHDFPRHNPYYLAALEAYAKIYPNAPQIGSMERSFHYSIPIEARAMGVPASFTDEYENPLGIGFHSASLRSVLYNTSRLLDVSISRLDLVIMHLGGTCTVEAVKKGRSVDTSLQWVASGGLLHNTAFAKMDPYLILKQIDERGISTKDMREMLAKEGGLQALSGVKGGDMKDILEKAKAMDPRAIFARDAFIYCARSHFGAYAYAALHNNVDAVVFAGGIGENGVAIRDGILKGADVYGFKIDSEKNENNEKRINTADSKPILIVPTDEELIVAFYTALVMKKGRDLKAEEMTGFLK